jgi:hypothetical protein
VLCEFARSFPDKLANLLDRSVNLRRNFREETATELLVMGLVPLEPFGVRVDLPDEEKTGADMDWIYAAPHDVGGGSYLRLMIQAKRAKCARRKGGDYWYYSHLDHGDPKGAQAQTLVTHAATSPDGMKTLPLYMFYHPRSAIDPPATGRPDVEGINIVFASDVEPVANGGCGVDDKKVDRWRDSFMSFSDLLCWPVLRPSPNPPAPDATQFLGPEGLSPASYVEAAWHPDIVADRLNELQVSRGTDHGAGSVRIEAGQGIPDHIQRAINRKETAEDRLRIERPRVIFSTSFSRESAGFMRARETMSGRRGRSES